MRVREEAVDEVADSEELLVDERTVRLPPRRARTEGALHGKARLVVLDENGCQRVIDCSATYLCDFGHVLSESRYVAAVCSVGGEWVCTANGCAAPCARCHAPTCPRHRVELPFGPHEPVCRRCALPAALGRLFGVGR